MPQLDQTPFFNWQTSWAPYSIQNFMGIAPWGSADLGEGTRLLPPPPPLLALLLLPPPRCSCRHWPHCCRCQSTTFLVRRSICLPPGARMPSKPLPHTALCAHQQNCPACLAPPLTAAAVQYAISMITQKWDNLTDGNATVYNTFGPWSSHMYAQASLV